MREKILLFLLFFLIAVAQVSFLANFFPSHLAPDAVLILVIIKSSKKSFEKNWLWAVVAGFILDILSLGIIGFNMISFFLISSLVSYLAQRFLVNNKLADFFTVAIFVVLGTVINKFIYIFLFQMVNLFLKSGKISLIGMVSLKTSLLLLLYNMIIFIIFYWLEIKWENIFQYNFKKPIVQ